MEWAIGILLAVIIVLLAVFIDRAGRLRRAFIAYRERVAHLFETAGFDFVDFDCEWWRIDTDLVDDNAGRTITGLSRAASEKSLAELSERVSALADRMNLRWQEESSTTTPAGWVKKGRGKK